MKVLQLTLLRETNWAKSTFRRGSRCVTDRSNTVIWNKQAAIRLRPKLTYFSTAKQLDARKCKLCIVKLFSCPKCTLRNDYKQWIINNCENKSAQAARHIKIAYVLPSCHSVLIYRVLSHVHLFNTLILTILLQVFSSKNENFTIHFRIKARPC